MCNVKLWMKKFYHSNFSHQFVLLVGNTDFLIQMLSYILYTQRKTTWKNHLLRHHCVSGHYYHHSAKDWRQFCQQYNSVNTLNEWNTFSVKTCDGKKVQPNQDFTLYFQGLWMSIEYEVLYVLATRIRFMCPMNFNRFPMDQQMCKFQVKNLFSVLFWKHKHSVLLKF